MKKCQELIDKVIKFRHFKVRQKQINEFNRLIEKEGNITWSGTPGAQTARVSAPQADSVLPLAARDSSLQTVSASPQAALPQASSTGPH